LKTQILQLEPHDDIISVRDKLNWRQASRVLLIWPQRGQVLSRRLDLVLLLRHCLALGIQLALVTDDPDVHYYANELGVSVFSSADQAQRTRWKRALRPKPLRNSPSPEERLHRRHQLEELRNPPADGNLTLGLRLGFFALAVLAVLSIAAAVFPTARIELNPQVRSQVIQLEVRALPGVERASLSGLVPLHTSSTVIEGRDSQPTSGQMSLPDGTASGEVTFTNLTDGPVSVPAQLIVTTPGSEVRFATQRGGQVPAGPGETLDLPVQALLSGSASNLPAGRLTAIQGQLGASLAVNNLSPTTGGSQAPAPAATSRDRSSLYDRLNATLQQNALEEIRSRLKPGAVLLDQQVEITRTLENSLEPAEGEPASQLDLLLRLEFQAPMVEEEDLAALANAVLDANLPPGFAPQPETLEIEQLSEPRLEASGEAHWQVRFRREMVAQLPVGEAINLALGQTPDQARARLSAALALAAPPVIRVKPDWWPRLPLLPIQIAVDQGK
jgi:hypothetical protein